MRLVQTEMHQGGYPPSVVQGVVSGTKLIRVHSVRALEFDGERFIPYSWRLNPSEMDMLKRLVREAAKKQQRKGGSMHS